MWIYIVFLCLGILTVFWVLRTRSVESFTTADAAPPEAPETNPNGAPDAPPAGNSEPAASVYTEPLMTSELPKTDAIQFYLTSFSDVVQYSSTQSTYAPTEMKWYNFLQNSASAFQLVGTLPNTIRSILEGDTAFSSVGLSIKNIKLLGPASQFACGQAQPLGRTQNELRLFSVVFFGRFQNLTFTDVNRRFILFQMFAENPNHVRWSIAYRDTTTCYLEVILGNTNTMYRWAVPISTVLSNGNATMYTLVHDVGTTDRTITVYVGTNKYTTKTNDMTPIRLGITPMEINSLSNTDMVLQSFMYMNNVLVDADIPKWTQYFVQESGGLSRTLNNLKTFYASEISTLANQLTNQTNSVDELQRALNECQAKIPAKTYEDKKELWKIKMDGDATISTTDAQKCSILSVPSRWEKEPKTVAPDYEGEDISGLKVLSPVPPQVLA